MKVKCEWDQEAICNRCAKHKTECIFTIPERKKREKKETYLTSLEDRLNRMEAVMLQSGISMPGKETDKPESEEIGIGDIPDKMSVLKIFDDGTALFLGSSSGFSIFGSQGLQWVTEITGSDEFAKLIMKIPSPKTAVEASAPSMWYKLPDDQHEPLPNRDCAMIYITEFFNGFGSIFPLFTKSIFMEKFEHQYPVTPSQDEAWYACLNVVFAIGSVILNKHQNYGSPKSTGSSPRSQNPEDEVWWKWFRNASSTYIDLQFREGNLNAVQAMIGMAFILQTLPNPYPCSVLASSALRLAQAIGLHRSIHEGFTPEQIEERRNVFWTGFVIERANLMRSGRPSVMQEDDIGIDLPKPNALVLPNQPQHLRYTSTLSLLQGRIYNKLYSAKAIAKPPLERLQWVSTLDEELEEWKDKLPVEIRPGNELKVDKQFIIPFLMMHYGYFNSLTTIHRCSIHYKSWANRGDAPISPEAMADMKLNPRVFASGAITVGAARSVIHLLEQTVEGIDMTELNIIRMLDYYPLSACLVLFANVLQNPLDPQARSDIGLMKGAVDFLSSNMESDSKSVSSMVLKTFKTVNDLAARYVEKTQSQGTIQSKRAREPLKTPNYTWDSNPFDRPSQPSVDKNMSDSLPASISLADQLDSTWREFTSSATPTTSYPSSTNTTQPAISSQSQSQSQFQSTPTSSITPSNSAPPFSIQQTLPNQPSTTSQFLSDPLTMYDNSLYNSNPSDLSSLPLDNTGMDFFPNDLLMPTDGSWFFPLGGNGTSATGENFGGTGMGGGGGNPGTSVLESGEGRGNGVGNGMSREAWLSTTGRDRKSVV